MAEFPSNSSGEGYAGAAIAGSALQHLLLGTAAGVHAAFFEPKWPRSKRGSPSRPDMLGPAVGAGGPRSTEKPELAFVCFASLRSACPDIISNAVTRGFERPHGMAFELV